MRVVVGLLVVGVALAGARLARVKASEQVAERVAPTTPYAPSPGSAPFISLGYREAAADLLYVRMIGYFNGDDSTGHGVGDLAEAIAALDPTFYRAYDHGANAMTLAKHGVTKNVLLRAIALLKQGMQQFPDDWQMPYLAGQIYTQDLTTDNPVERKAWDERGTLLVESAVRKPGAPTGAATWTAMMRTRLGQHQRATASLREMLLVTSNQQTRQRLLDALAALEERDATAVASEIMTQRLAFERQWKTERPAVNASMYILLGPRLARGFDMADLATGGRDLYVHDPSAELLEPVE